MRVADNVLDSADVMANVDLRSVETVPQLIEQTSSALAEWSYTVKTRITNLDSNVEAIESVAYLTALCDQAAALLRLTHQFITA